jgi:CO dehydrogenase nickel-insertion accessory protein CooC1
MVLDILVVGEQSRQRQIDRLNWSLLGQHNVGFVYTDRPESWARNTLRDYDILLITEPTKKSSSTAEYFEKVRGIAEALNKKRGQSISYIVAPDTLSDKKALAKKAEKAGIAGLVCWDQTWCKYFMMSIDGTKILMPRRLYEKKELRIQAN